MIKKIISGGQTGADQAALDVAIKLDIPHSGWIPRGRKTEAGILPKKYNLKELTTTSYPIRTEKNVVDSDGTLILTHGALTVGSQLTQRMASKHGRPCLHIDLNKTNAFQAAVDISTWVKENSISVLNVAGSRASKDPKIYDAVMGILESALILGLSKGPAPESLQTQFSNKEKTQERSFKPSTVSEAVDDFILKLPLKDKTTLANMTEDELLNLHFSLGKYIRNKYGVWKGNEDLISDCRTLLKKDAIHEDEASSFIIKKLWEKLRKTHRLKVVK